MAPDRVAQEMADILDGRAVVPHPRRGRQRQPQESLEVAGEVAG